ENHSHGEIEVNVGYDEMKRVVIEIKDNGPGIPPELAEKIFIPFFSTKDRGSGIGLSYSRQIMSMHQGSLSMVTDSEEGTIFTMVF
ncbi:MAG: ATP-binding protein, partial [Bacteroidetes bacterium]|nr:ATP-binding protein [Bacteroidota bacterium]